MRRKISIASAIILSIGLIVASILSLKGYNIPVLQPKGTIGIKERDLLVVSFLLMLIVVIPVFIFTFLFAWKYHYRKKESKYTPDWDHSHIAEIIWWGVPFLIIIVLAVLTYISSHMLNPFKPIENGKKPLEIQVVALQWKWLFIYPEQQIATVNYVQFPEDTPLSFEITADAPMNSFWIPQLGGQIYAMPAMRSKLHLIANEKGTFRGCSANLSGEGFSGMVFTAKATSPEDFEKWAQSIRRSSPRLTEAEYERLAKPSSYDPVMFYRLSAKGLFDQIIMKYSTTAEK